MLRQTAAFAALRTASSLLTWGSVIALSRILDPRAFGTFEIGIFWIGLGQLVGDGGLAASVIRYRGDPTNEHYRIAQTFAFFVAVGSAAIFFFAAPWIGHHNELSEAEIWALRGMAPLYVLPAFRLVPYVKLEREINFAAIGKIELAANALRHVTAIGTALILGSVWALIASQVALATSQVVLAHLVRPGWVGIGWNTRTFRELFSYGSKVQIGNFFLYLKRNVAGGLLGFALGPTAVGIFGFGLAFVNVPSDAVNGLARVQFPAHARLDKDDPELYRILRGATRGALLVGLPVLGFLVAVAEWAVPTFYSDKWIPALPVIWALVPHLAADLIALHLVSFIQGQGRAGLAVWVYASWSLGLWGLVALSLWFTGGSLPGVGAAYGVASVGTVVFLLAWASRHLGKPLGRDVSGPLVAAAAGFSVVWVMGGWMGSVPAQRALGQGTAFLVTYLSVLVAVEGRIVLEDLRRTMRALVR